MAPLPSDNQIASLMSREIVLIWRRNGPRSTLQPVAFCIPRVSPLIRAQYILFLKNLSQNAFCPGCKVAAVRQIERKNDEKNHK